MPANLFLSPINHPIQLRYYKYGACYVAAAITPRILPCCFILSSPILRRESTSRMEEAHESQALLPSPIQYATVPVEAEALIEQERSNTPVVHRSIDDDTVPEAATFGRNLSWSSAYILVISRVIGSGVFATPGSIVKSAGSIGLTISLWIAGTILSGCGLVVSLELGCMLPRSGGEKVYLEYTYRHPRFLASTLIAVQAVLLGFSASNCIIFSKYTLFALDMQPSEFQHKILAAGLLTAVTFIHGRFLKAGIWVQDAIGWVKIFLVATMSCTGIWVILFRDRGLQSPEHEASNVSWDKIWGDSNWSWGLLSTSMFKVFYSYAGLTNVNNVLNEVRNPVKTLKTVGPAALFTACGLYLLANISYFLVVPIEKIKSSGELVAALFFEQVFGAHVGRTLFPLAIAISAAGNVMVVTFATVCFLFCPCADLSNTICVGKNQPRNSPSRLPPLLSDTILVSPLQFPPGRAASALRPLSSRHHTTAAG